MSYGLRQARHDLPGEAKRRASSDQIAEQSLSAMLDSLHHTLPRNAEAAACGRAAFLAEAAAMRDEFVHKPARGVWGRLSELIKRCLGIGRSSDESPSLPTPLRRVSASLVPGLMATFASMTIVVVAQNSLPNQPLYPVKMWSEDVQLSLTAEPDSRLVLLIKFINCRVSELNALYQRGESPSTGFMLRLEAQVSEALQLLNAQSGSDAYDAATVHALERLRAIATAPLPFMISPDRVFHTSVPLPAAPTVAPTGTPAEKVMFPIIVGTASGAPTAVATGTPASHPAAAAPSPTFTPAASVPLITFTAIEENTAAQTNEKATHDTIQAVGDSVDIKASLPTAVAITVPAPPIEITPQPVQVIPTPQPTVMPQPTPTPLYVAPTPQPTAVPQPTPTPVYVAPTLQPTAMPQPTPTPLALVPIPVVPTTVKPAPPLLPVEPIAPPALPIDTPAAPALPILPTVMNPVPAPIFSLENPEATATPLPDESMRTTAPPTLGPMPDQTQQQGEPSGNE